MNTYKATHHAACPNGNLMDHYEITIISAGTIMVESIIESLASAPKEIYQENLADYLRSKLGAHVIVEGWHHGIYIKSERL
jgi:hypothetical protein